MWPPAGTPPEPHIRAATDRLPLVAVDLVDVVEDSWPQKRAWLFRELGFEPGPVPHSRAWVEAFVRRRLGIDGHECYEWMSAFVSRPESLARRPVVAGAAQGLRRLRRLADVRLLSGRREAKRAATESWLQRRGLQWLCGRNLVLLDYRPRRSELQGKSPKLAWCQEHGALALIDNQAAQLGPAPGSERVVRILYSADPEEQRRAGAGVLMAKSWDDVPGLVKRLRRRSPSAA